MLPASALLWAVRHALGVLIDLWKMSNCADECLCGLSNTYLHRPHNRRRRADTCLTVNTQYQDYPEPHQAPFGSQGVPLI